MDIFKISNKMAILYIFLIKFTVFFKAKPVLKKVRPFKFIYPF